MVLFDSVINGYDLAKVDLKDTLIQRIAATERRRYLGALVSIRCKTWSAANSLPDTNGNPGQPRRDVDHFYCIPRRKHPTTEASHATLLKTPTSRARGGDLPCSGKTRQLHDGPRHLLEGTDPRRTRVMCSLIAIAPSTCLTTPTGRILPNVGRHIAISQCSLFRSSQ